MPQNKRIIVFYSEGPTYWVHLEPLVRHLLSDHDVPVCYLSSSPADPGLDFLGGHGAAFLIGDGAVRNVLFKNFPSGVLVMTMPDLQSFHIERSVHPVHYVYVHHSIVSTHMVYRPEAFDHFDTIFCVGPHHISETRKREQQCGLPAKNLFEHGYGRLDSISATASARPQSTRSAAAPLRLLLAPSWGEHGLLETQGLALVEILLRAGFHLTVRPHPQTARLSPTVIAALRKRYSHHSAFVFEEDVASAESLYSADIMISDWSGAALEFAYGLERPVLFVDVPRKVRNPGYASLDIDPLEVRVRDVIGEILAIDRLEEAPQYIKKLNDDRHLVRERIRDSRRRWVYNRGKSGALGAARLVEIAARIA